MRLLGGLTSEEIARAFLVPEATIQQRIVRAKRTLSESGVKFEVPRGDELEARLSSVLAVIYLIFNEGYSATAGEDWMRPQALRRGLRLGRILAELAPEEPEVHGLVALMEIQASRFGARTGPDGEPVLLLDQDRSRWDRLLIRRGLAALDRRSRSPPSDAGHQAPTPCKPRSPPATRGRAPPTPPTGRKSSDFIPGSAELLPSPIVELNRAVALAMLFGPEAGLRSSMRYEGAGAQDLSSAAERAWRSLENAWPVR